MKLDIFFRKKKIRLDVKKTLFLGNIFGLMFRTQSTENLLFSFSEDTDTEFHSFFVFFPFLMLWLDEKKIVIEWRIIMPFSTIKAPKKKFRNVVEIPCNPKNEKIIKIFVGRGKI